MVHVSASCNPAFHATGAHYINGDTTAFMQFITGDLFRDFPTLKFIIPHGGGAVPYHWGRYRGLAQDMKRPPLKELLMNNVFFDTCVYHQPGIDLLLKVIPADNILFASEMVGAVKGVDPETGFNYDDTKRYVDARQGEQGRQGEDLPRQRAQGVPAFREAGQQALNRRPARASGAIPVPDSLISPGHRSLRGPPPLRLLYASARGLYADLTSRHP